MDKIVEKILNKMYGPTWKEKKLEQNMDLSIIRFLFDDYDDKKNKNSYAKYYPRCNRYNDNIQKTGNKITNLDNININQIKREKGLDIISTHKYNTNVRFTNDRVCGAYIIVYETGEKYIGSSRDIYRRLKNHLSLSEQIVDTYTYLTKNYIDAILVERYLYSVIDCINRQTPIYIS